MAWNSGNWHEADWYGSDWFEGTGAAAAAEAGYGIFCWPYIWGCEEPEPGPPGSVRAELVASLRLRASTEDSLRFWPDQDASYRLREERGY